MKKPKLEHGVGCAVLVGVLLVIILVFLPAVIIGEIIGENSLLDAVTELLLYLGLGVVVLVVARSFNISLVGMTGSLEQFSAHIRYTTWVVPLIIISLATTYLSLSGLALVNETWFYWYMSEAEYLFEHMESYRESALLHILVVMMTVVAAPVVEEYLFRGVLLSGWGMRWGATRAILLSSFIFGVLHLDPIGAFVFGVALCLIYYHTGSLLLVIVIHVLNNALALVLMEFPELVQIETPADVYKYLGYIVALAVVAGLLIAPTVRRIWPEKDALPPVAR